MANLHERYDALYRQVANCDHCCEDAKIRELHSKGEFKYRWEPWRVGAPPYKLILIAMEPNSGYEPNESYPQPGAFNEPLRFAVNCFLLPARQCEGYLITNLAKCSMPVHEARQTESYRYETCAPFLRSEIEYARPDSWLISIGKTPKDFVDAHRNLYGLDDRRIHCIRHYGFMNTNRFLKYAEAKSAEYEAFGKEHGPQYEAFLRGEGREDQARNFISNPDYDLSRIFKYSHQMTEIAEIEAAD